MASMIVDKAEKNGKLTEEEKRKLNEVIEQEEGSDRVPKEEESVMESLKKELKRLKIENNRTEPETRVHYGDRLSRKDHQNWPSYKSNQRSGSRSEYQRSDSRPGWWRSKSGNRYQRFRSRTPTKQDGKGSQREGSGNRSEKSLKERVTTMETNQKCDYSSYVHKREQHRIR